MSPGDDFPFSVCALYNLSLSSNHAVFNRSTLSSEFDSSSAERLSMAARSILSRSAGCASFSDNLGTVYDGNLLSGRPTRRKLGLLSTYRNSAGLTKGGNSMPIFPNQGIQSSALPEKTGLPRVKITNLSNIPQISDRG
jgi:hypothetical protein